MNSGRVGLAALCFVALATVSADRCQTGSPAGDTGQPEVEFEVVGALEGSKDPPVTIDSIAPGEVVLTGALATPTPCYAINAGVTLRDRTLSLSLTATAQPGMICIQTLGAFAYRARIHGLSTGRYTLEVVATYPGTGWETRTERLEVEVP